MIMLQKQERSFVGWLLDHISKVNMIFNEMIRGFSFVMSELIFSKFKEISFIDIFIVIKHFLIYYYLI